MELGQEAPWLPADAALPGSVGPSALSGAPNPLLSLLRRGQEWREQEERWCEGKAPGAHQGLLLPTGLIQGLLVVLFSTVP